MDAVEEEVDGCETTRQEGAPPPVIVLRTKMEIAEQNGGFRAGDYKNYKDKEKETKHVVHLMGPNGIEDEEQLDEDAAKGQNAAHDNSRQGTSVE